MSMSRTWLRRGSHRLLVGWKSRAPPTRGVGKVVLGSPAARAPIPSAAPCAVEHQAYYLEPLRERRIVVASIAAAALLMHAACSGSSEEAGGSEETGRVEPEVWATDICTAFREHEMSRDSAGREIADEIRAASSAKQLKAALVMGWTEALDETDAMLKKVDAAGTPAGEQGEEVRRAIRNAAGQLRRVVAEVLSQTQDLPTRNISAFNSELEALVHSAELAFEEVERQFSDLQYLEALDYEGEPPEACQDLATSG